MPNKKNKSKGFKDFLVSVGIAKIIPVGLIAGYLFLKHVISLPYKLLISGMNPYLVFTSSVVVANFVCLPISWLLLTKLGGYSVEDKRSQLVVIEIFIMFAVLSNYFFWYMKHLL